MTINRAQMKRTSSRVVPIVVVGGLGILLLATAGLFGQGARASSVVPTPISNDNNPSCSDFGAWTEFKIDAQPTNGTYSGGTLPAGVVITISNAGLDTDGVYRFDWSVNLGFGMDAVLVKQADDAHNLYIYNPEATSDTELGPQAGANQGGISHVSFCFDGTVPTATNTATTTAVNTATNTPTTVIDAGTETPTNTPQPTSTGTVTATPEPTETPVPTQTNTPTATPTLVAGETEVPTNTPVATPTLVAGETEVPTNTPIATPTLVAGETVVATNTAISTPTQRLAGETVVNTPTQRVAGSTVGSRATPRPPSTGTGTGIAGEGMNAVYLVVGLAAIGTGGLFLAVSRRKAG